MNWKNLVSGKISIALLITSAMLLAGIGFLLNSEDSAVMAKQGGGENVSIQIDTINGQGPQFNFDCPSNPLFSPVTITGSGNGTAPPGNIEQYKVQVDWGDGQVTNGLGTFNPSSGQGSFTFNFTAGPHTYASGGNYDLIARLYHSQPPGNDNQADAFVKIPICVVVQPECTPGATSTCSTGLPGICAEGTKTCQLNGTWGSCVQNNASTTENCSNGLDDDCDGLTDSNDSDCWQCTPNATTTCETGLPGICSAGTQTCQLNGTWGSCVQNNASTTEVCNGIDDDCDGAVDEDGVCGQEQPQQPTGGGGTGSFTYFTVYVKVLGGVGKVTSQPSGIDCGSVCQENFNINSTVILTATPAEGFSFDHWEGDCQGTETTCTLTMDATKSVRAVFSGQVLGEATEAPSCGIYLREYIKYGAPNNPEEVKKLQAFLNSYMGANLEVTGVYDLITMDWVNKFQLKCKEEVLRPWVEAGVHPSEDVPTGYVYKTTQRWINMLMCPALNLPMPDLSEDVARLKAVGAKEITGEVAGEATEAEEEIPATQEEMPPTGEEMPPVEVKELEVETKEEAPPAPTTPSPQGGMSGGLIALGALVVLAGVGLWYTMKGKKKK